MPEWNTGGGSDNRIELRVGINLGDVIVEGDELYGDGVNIAARIKALADAGGVFVSNTVHDHVRDRLSFVFEDLGEQQVKNICPADAGLPGPRCQYRRQKPCDTRFTGATPPRQAVDRGAAVRQSAGDREEEYFIDGMVEEIITALSRLFVLARNSSFSYRVQSVDVKQVGRELGGLNGCDDGTVT